MILYHGSYLVIDKPDLLHTRSNVDFGPGFYTTPIRDQAVKWCGKFIRRKKEGILSKYTFDETAYSKCKIKQYEKPNLQICFRTQWTMDQYLHFEGSEKI